ncbi:hypothetical protein BC833DRAFT_587997 [Globomyces pollinis-pini]|nr:hypothetical protein BC833DRAFT_587997 [Globomyces pollinis-pini]KAJ2997466.1 putative protein CXorf58 [Globomyces sp. JEL0801]
MSVRFQADDVYQELTGFTDRTETHTPFSFPAREPVLLTPKQLTPKEIAAIRIQKFYKRVLMKRTFRWLKHNLFRCERMLTREVLKRLSPTEGRLLKDPAYHVKVRFRLGGSVFPPAIYYKIYTTGFTVHYFNGHDIIHPGSQASEDAIEIMGSKLYQEKIVMEELHQNENTISKIYEVTDKMEYIQYLNTLDKKAPHLGGRNNDWRELKITQFGDQSVVFDARNPGDTLSKLLKRPKYPHEIAIAKKKEAVVEKQRNFSVHLIETHLDDDFRDLFDWSSNLDNNHLNDYEVTI